MKALKIKKSDHTKPKPQTSRAEKIPFYIFMSSIAFILISLVLIYLVDLRNLWGTRDVLYFWDERSIRFISTRPFMFNHLYCNRGIAEIFQWILLGGAALISMFISGLMYNRNRIILLFWAIMSAAFTLMLIEDAGDPRHTISTYFGLLFNSDIAPKMVEGVYFTILAAIPIYALLQYRKPVMADSRTARYIVIGFIGYATAAIFSFAGDFTVQSDESLYIWAGGKIRSVMLLISDKQTAVQWSLYENEQKWPAVNYFLMDSMVEESIELMAAAAFCASAVAFLLYVRRTYSL